MLVVYLVALVVGLGVIGVQTFAGHDADAGGHELAHADHDAPAWALVASVRFWSFALVAFGFCGALITLFGFVGAGAALGIAGVAGATSGALAATIVRRMTTRGPSSQVLHREVVGRVGRVLVPSERGVRGKVRVEIKGSSVDYVALSDERLETGEAVIVEECEGGEVVVSKAPKELKA